MLLLFDSQNCLSNSGFSYASPDEKKGETEGRAQAGAAHLQLWRYQGEGICQGAYPGYSA